MIPNIVLALFIAATAAIFVAAILILSSPVSVRGRRQGYRMDLSEGFSYTAVGIYIGAILVWIIMGLNGLT